MELECEVYVLRLVANRLYTITFVCEMTFPSNDQELKGYGLHGVITELYLLLCKNVKAVIEKNHRVSDARNKSKMKSFAVPRKVNLLIWYVWRREFGPLPPYNKDDQLSLLLLILLLLLYAFFPFKYMLCEFFYNCL